MKVYGFTLLEAMVALILFTTVGMALLSWVNTNLISLQRVQAVQQSQQAIRNALAMLDRINPLEKQQGEETIGIYQIKWRAKAVQPQIDGMSPGGYISLFRVGLYDVEVEIYLENQETALTHFTVRQVGFKQVYNFKKEISE
jgi:general secretion pathway protein I